MRNRPPDDHAVDTEAERHATNLELFLDLVFVFAITQIAGLVHGDLTPSGVGKGAIVWGLVWWQWSQFTWAGSAIDLQRAAITRTLVLVTVPVTLTMAAAIPTAYGGGGLWFAGANLAVQLLVLGMQGSDSLAHEVTRAPYLRYASIAVIAPVIVFAGAFVDGGGRVGLWGLALAVNVFSAIRAASVDDGEWFVNPVHFAERHALFVIISLGEVLVTIGASASAAGLTGRVFVGLLVSGALACVMWWTYFAYIPNVAESVLRAAQGSARGRAARDMYTFGHAPLVLGVVAYAVAVRSMVPAPTDPLATASRAMLAAAVALIVGAYMKAQWMVVRRVSPERYVTVVVCGVWCLVARSLPGWLVVAGITVALAAMQSISWRRFRGGALAHLTPNR